MEENIECVGFTFYNNFDSANLAKVEKVEINKAENGMFTYDFQCTQLCYCFIIKIISGKNENNKSHKNSTLEVPSYEFNLWTKQDCHGTEFQNNNRTWFHFGIKASMPGSYVKLNLVNLNKQVKMFSQGMCPVFKVIPGHPQWDRIKEKPTFMADDKNNEFMLSFNYRASENPNAITYFAFTYPFSYTDLQNYLKKIDAKMSKQNTHLANDIYYHRECAIKSLEGRRLDILTISSYYNKSVEREAKIKDLFPEENEERPYKFYDKKIIFLSARVHPGETPSSFVLNGFINLLLNKDDQIAIMLRRLYVFKLIPMLNPDGVAQGYYRMDTRGVNLNRLYLNPSKIDHPTIFAAKQLLRYYHNWYRLPEDLVPDVPDTNNIGTSTFDLTNNINSISNETNKLLQRVTLMSLEEKNKRIEQGSRVRNYLVQASEKSIVKNQGFMDYQPKCIDREEDIPCRKIGSASNIKQYSRIAEDSGIFLYVDFHGHASKKGIFMYGNHFDDAEDASACMLLPKLMSINNSNFHFTSCNFAEKNMYLIDKRDGMSREGSGRVAVHKLFGLIHSYTLECNYNTGRLVNSVPARLKENVHKLHSQIFVPPKYNPTVFEEVGAAFGPSILDMTGSNPNSRLPNSQYRSLKGLKSYLKLISTNHYQTTLNKPLLKIAGKTVV
ncbi:cytosolic carboxypeptidase-like protein 5 isoform X2 [Phymastichus coffea]|uniref:cytosolic carboxypeptidase-like protein 5 isoform X2 n=1 Tax=Phymastichus coffea TaxID=108790 RepID=UPI00273BA394|nr:cytosolic carboxypeptidase-like protein 5 isoform X2 [Phymastichus coffea]